MEGWKDAESREILIGLLYIFHKFCALEIVNSDHFSCLSSIWLNKLQTYNKENCCFQLNETAEEWIINIDGLKFKEKKSKEKGENGE